MKLLLPLIIIVAIALGFMYMRQQSAQPKREIAISEEAVTDQNDREEPVPLESNYIPYTQTALTQTIAANKKAVIFFHAAWCPTCRAAEEHFLGNNEGIPENVTILKADYDSESDLKVKYGVVTQHTFVQVDQNGNEITKWVGGHTEELLSNIQ